MDDFEDYYGYYDLLHPVSISLVLVLLTLRSDWMWILDPDQDHIINRLEASNVSG